MELPIPTSLATTPESLGRVQARRLVDAGADLVIVVGGDGTIRAVAHELAGSDVRMGIVALGSGNVLAYNLGVTRLDLAGQVTSALAGSVAALDVGWAQLRTVDGDLEPEPFLTMVGIGRDAETVAHTSHDHKRRLGWVAYGAAGLRTALRPPLAMWVKVDDLDPRLLRTWTVLAGITPAAPGGALIHPGALVDDGLLDVLAVPIRHPGQWLAIGFKGMTHHRLPVAGLRSRRARELRVRPADPQAVQLDGDVVPDVTELYVTIATRSLLVQLPRQREHR